MDSQKKKLIIQKPTLIKKNESLLTDSYIFDPVKDVTIKLLQLPIVKKIGQGSYGSVFRATHKQTQQIRAIKMINKDKISHKLRVRLLNEITIMELLDHPTILRLYETFEDHDAIYMILELCQGGDVFDKVLEKSQLDKQEAMIVFVQYMRAVYYYQSFRIVHRDLKPENFLFFYTNDLNTLTVIDFGISKKYNDGMNSLNSKSGTAYYVSPEVLDGSYNEKCDIWSSGVVLYVLLCGYPPFYGENEKEILQEIKRGQLNFDGAEWDHCDFQTKELIVKMICPLAVRLSAKEVIQDPLIQEFIQNTQRQPDELKRHFSLNMLQWMKYPLIKQLALFYLVTQLDQLGSVSFKTLFFDINRSQTGKITLEEFLTYFGKFISKNELSQLFQTADCNCNGFLDYFGSHYKLAGIVISKEQYNTESNLQETFRFLSNYQQKITFSSLQKIFISDFELETKWSSITQLPADQRITKTPTSNFTDIDYLLDEVTKDKEVTLTNVFLHFKRSHSLYLRQQ